MGGSDTQLGMLGFPQFPQPATPTPACKIASDGTHHGGKTLPNKRSKGAEYTTVLPPRPPLLRPAADNKFSWLSRAAGRALTLCEGLRYTAVLIFARSRTLPVRTTADTNE